jgi:predicted dehydrogenase
VKQAAYLPRTGAFAVINVPPPGVPPRGYLVCTTASVISAGTERAAISFGRQNLLQKARSRPDLVRRTLDKARRDGIGAAFGSARERLDRWAPLGYSLSGTVIAVGDQVDANDIRVGDRVACAGASQAVHAEIVAVPQRLTVKLPDNVSFEIGAFATLGAIALQGIRQADVTLGCDVAVIGLGLIGQLTVQLLRAAGCHVVGVDPNATRAALAKQLGANQVCRPNEIGLISQSATHGRGFDAVIITADSQQDDLLTMAGHIARDRAVIVVVGAIPIAVPRTLFYEKELQVRLSRSYGPGRYDASYEQLGHDYPPGYVRFTEQRNLEAFLRTAAQGTLQIEPLISARVPIAEAVRGYTLLTDTSTGVDLPLGVLLTYPVTDQPISQRIDLTTVNPKSESAIRLGVIGAGNFANATLLPALRGLSGLDQIGIMSGAGLSARQSAERFGFTYCASDIDELLNDARINWLAVLTRHNQHAAQTVAGLLAGKDVFVEKPLTLNRAELIQVIQTQRTTGRRLMVGFNRRFAPMVQAMRAFRPVGQPITALIRVNAGAIPVNHWTRQSEIGGGRIIGEGCHFVDLLTYLIGTAPRTIYAVSTGNPDSEATLTLTFADGSTGLILYATGGDPATGKERIEWFGGGRSALLEDYRTLTLSNGGKITRQRRNTADKGHRGLWLALIQAVQNGQPTPIPLTDLITSHLTTFAALDSLHSGQPVDLAADAAAFWAEVN